MEKKASCYDICPIGHNCFGGFIGEEKLCDDEIARIKAALQDENPDSTILFAPQNITGLRFKIIKSPSQPKVVYKLHEGEITLFT
jgi:hypothetical protein